MKAYAFAIIASGLDPEADDFMERLFEAGCDDASASYQKGLIVLAFTRESKSFAQAIISAFEDVHKTGATIERFEPDTLVTLTDISERTGLSKSAISLYAKGERGKAFPSPVARVTTDSPLWDWVDVSRWMHGHNKLPIEAVLEARTVREASDWARSKTEHHHLFAKKIENALADEAA